MRALPLNFSQHIGVIGMLFAGAPFAYAQTTDYENPVKWDTLIEFLNAFFGVLITLGTILLAVMIIYTGYLFVIAQGNAEKLTTAKRAFVWVLVGGAILLGAWALQLGISDTILEMRANGNTT